MLTIGGSMSREIIDQKKEHELLERGWTKREVRVLLSGQEKGYAAISDSLSEQFYRMFLEGRTPQEICNENPPFLEKDILYLRYRKDWDAKRQEYLKNLVSSVQQRYAQSKLESAKFLMDLLSVSHKKYGKQMAKYLQTEKEEDFPEMPSLKYYKEIVETLAKITGEDKKVQVEGSIIHQVDTKKDDKVIEVNQSDFLRWLAEKNGFKKQ